jgi:hypothetical protein
MYLELRTEQPLTDDDLLVVHMGAGDANRVLPAVLAAHDAWFPIRQHGQFAFSVFAAATDQVRDTIISSFKFGQYGTATVAEIRSAGLEIIPTNTVDIDDDMLTAIQPFHYSLVIREGFATPIIEMNEQSVSELSVELVEVLAAALQLFSPREKNQLKRS